MADAKVSLSVTRQFSYDLASRSEAVVNHTMGSVDNSTGGNIPSAKGSMLSESWSCTSKRLRSGSQGSRLTQLPEPKQEGLLGLSDSMDASRKISNQGLNVRRGDAPQIVPPSWLESSPQPASHDQTREGELQIPREDLSERPTRATSTDTHRQATNLFVDFDGVHFTGQGDDLPSIDLETSRNPRRSMIRPASATRPQSYAEPLPGENLVYYPAPVPMMLNLPQRLSKAVPATEREKRRSQVLSGLFTEVGRPAPSLPGAG